MDVIARIERCCRPDVDERELRVAVVRELAAAVPFDAYVWVLTDPVSCVGWSPVADVPELAVLPEMIRAKYLTTVNRWTELAPGAVATLVDATAGDRSRSALWRQVQSKYGVSDVASAVLRDQSGCWGFIDIWRIGGVFDRGECATLGAVTRVVTPALRRALLPTFATGRVTPAEGPAVVLLGDDLRPIAQTAPTGGYLQALLPADPGAAVVPAAAINVAAQLIAVEAGVDARPAEARIFVPGHSWMTIRAGRIDPPGSVGATIAVTIEPTRPTERARLYARVAALTDRETEVLDALATGDDTRHAARHLAISANTVQDHLKAIFTKTGADSRRQLLARATGTID